MPTDKFQNKYRIPSARAPWHGYDGGIYFVTICTDCHDNHYFGKIMVVNNEPHMHLSEIGKFAHENFANVSLHYTYAEIPLFVVMPNHIHAIVVIGGDGCIGRDVARNVSTITTTSIKKNETMAAISPQRGQLSTVIRGLKSAITKYAHSNNFPFAWQARFYDHIIRQQTELNHIAAYIENNVINWANDKLNNNRIISTTENASEIDCNII
ncbi:MAG: hypothetical protein PHQ33_08605 [Bacteroidales bacterium]|nr:hypothetical protein [Bacteroidales bacterium]